MVFNELQITISLVCPVGDVIHATNALYSLDCLYLTQSSCVNKHMAVKREESLILGINQ